MEPKHLRPNTLKWYQNVLETYELEEHHRRLLLMAAESFDLWAAACEIINKHGMTYEDRFGCPKPRPEIAVARDSKIAFARLIRELGLDIEAPDDVRVPRLATTGRSIKAVKHA